MQTPSEDGLTPVRKVNLYMRFVKGIYLVVHTLVSLVVLLAAGALYLAFRPDGLSLVKTFFLEPLGIHISRADGSLSEGFSLHDLHSKAIDAKTLKLDYNLTTILKGEHIIDAITIDGLQVHLDDFVGDSGSALPLPLFKIKEVALTNIQLISSYPIELNFHGKNGSYDGNNLNFASVQSTIKSRYASGAIQGSLKNNTLRGNALVYPSASQLQDTSGRFITLPTSQRIIVEELSPSRVKLHTVFDQLISLNDPLVTLHNVALDMDYRYDDDYLNFKTDYLLTRGADSIQTHQELRYALNGVTTTSFKGVITSSYPLPTNIVEAKFRDDADGVAGKLVMGNTTLALQSSDYNTFTWELDTVQKDLNSFTFLPESLRKSPLAITAQGDYALDTQRMYGNFRAHHNQADVNGSIDYANDAIDLKINGPRGMLSVRLADNQLKGSGNFADTIFQIDGFKTDQKSDITITSYTPSAWQTLKKLGTIALPKGEYYDAEIQTNTHMTYDTDLKVTTDITVPWYAAVLDSQRQYGGTHNTLSLRYANDTFLIDTYRLDIAGHEIGSKRLSSAHLNDAGNLLIDELWIFDALRLNGEINTKTFAAELALHSDKFTYKGPEGEAHAAMDLLFTRNAQSVQTLSGNVEILNAKITYLPLQQLKVMDNDVIIVQDVRPPSDTSLFMNIQLTAHEPLHYLTKELDILIVPELTLWKEPTGPIQFLGMVTLPEGTAKTSGKEFVLKPSHLYFAGGDTINPYLDFAITHEVDYKKIQIFITHRLDSPIFLFSSDPFMSQNDIMSYLLFGSPADASLNSDRSKTATKTDATNFMLGAGVKGLINNTTKIQIDTMNILTTQEGGMGIEVGAHLNKDLRVLYKNDTVSSVLVQYQLNRWLRLDADIHELGQGINAIYIKDFHDYLPHNTVLQEKH
jgi:translocation and assembly module TamB